MPSIQEDEYFFMKKWDEIWSGPKDSNAYKILEKIVHGNVTKLRQNYGKFWEVDGIDVDTPEEIKNQLFFT